MIVLLFTLTLYVNYVMHFKKDISKVERSIIMTEQRILKEEKLFEEREFYSDINATKDYNYLFFDGKKNAYSSTMGEFQQLIGTVAKESNCKITNTQWQDMPMNMKKQYTILSLKIFFECKAQSFIDFQNNLRKKDKLLFFKQLHFMKNRRKNFLNIRTVVYAFRSREDEK